MRAHIRLGVSVAPWDVQRATARGVAGPLALVGRGVGTSQARSWGGFRHLVVPSSITTELGVTNEPHARLNLFFDSSRAGQCYKVARRTHGAEIAEIDDVGHVL